MRAMVNLDDALLEQAQRLSGVKERGDLLREALQALIQRESAARLAHLGGTEPMEEALHEAKSVRDSRRQTAAKVAEVWNDFQDRHGSFADEYSTL